MYVVAPTGLSAITSRLPSPQSIIKFPAAPIIILKLDVFGVVVIVNVGALINVSIAVFVAIVSAAARVAYSPLP